MADTTFIAGTPIVSAWLNDVNDCVYGPFPAATALGARLAYLRTPLDSGTAIPATSFAVGPGAGTLTTGIGNLAVGYNTLSANIVGQYSTAVGANNQTFATGLGFNTSFGYGTAYNLTSGYSNVAAGFEALHDCQAGTANCALGYSAQHYGLANGGVRDTNNVTGVGTFALRFNQADNVVAVGYSALAANTGSGNTAMGYNVAVSNTSGSQSTFLGESAGANKTVGAHDTMVGFQAGLTQTTSIGFNSYFGSLAGFYNTTATQNAFFGYQAGQGTSGLNGGGGNVAMGNQAMGLCGSVTGCVAVGNTALRSVTGNSNVGIGSNAGANTTTGVDNTFVGTSSGSGVSTSTRNVAVGRDTLGNMNGGENTAVGYNAGTPAAPQVWTNTTSLGNGALPTGSNQVTLGNASVATIRAQVTTITALSDVRDKTNIKPLELGLEFINLIDPVEFTWKTREGSARDGEREAGFIAQELKAAQTKAGADWLGLVLEANPDRMEATPGKLLPIMVKAIQELSAKVAYLEAQLNG
jgi:hypothetical protein